MGFYSTFQVNVNRANICWIRTAFGEQRGLVGKWESRQEQAKWKESYENEGGLFEGGADLAALQRLRRPVVVHHAAWRFSLSSEQEAAELIHLTNKERQGKTVKDNHGLTCIDWVTKNTMGCFQHILYKSIMTSASTAGLPNETMLFQWSI